MLLIGTQNTGTQTVLTDGIVSLGTVYRKYCKKANNCLPTFTNDSNSITLNGQGVYHITATLVGAGTTAGTLTVQMLENGVPVVGGIASETITTADTELRTLVIDRYVLVDNTCLLGCTSTLAKTISFENTGVGATFSNVVVNVEKVVKYANE